MSAPAYDFEILHDREAPPGCDEGTWYRAVSDNARAEISRSWSWWRRGWRDRADRDTSPELTEPLFTEADEGLFHLDWQGFSIGCACHGNFFELPNQWEMVAVIDDSVPS